METLMGLCMGLALAAACGFRVFLPLLVMSIGARAGMISLGDNFEWLASWPAIVGFGTAALLEIIAYFWPWLDHALDTIATPAAIIAGTLATASQIEGMNPALTWLTGLIAGGGLAGGTQAATVSTRGASTVTTGGLLNPIINAIQAAVSAVLSVLAVVVPIAAGLLVLSVALLVVTLVVRRARRRREARESAGLRLAA